MKVSDHTMTMLTGLVLTLTVGMLAQNSDAIMSGLGGGNVLSIADDSFTVRAGRDQALDVLLNDKVPDEMGLETLVVTEKPSCGLAEVRDGQFTFTGSADCRGPITLSYCLEDKEGCAEGHVALNVLAPPNHSQGVATADEAEIASATHETPVLPEAAGAAADISDTEVAQLTPLAEPPATAAEAEVAELETELPLEPAPGTSAPPVLAQTVTVTAPSALLPDLPQVPAETAGPGADSFVVAAREADDALTGPDLPATEPAPSCDVAAEATALRGGRVRLTLDAPCHPNAVTEIAEGDFRFNTVTGADGKLDITIPAFAAETTVVLALETGISRRFDLSVPDAGDYMRVALVWSGDADLDLRAAEFGARPGEPGYVWQGAPGSARQARSTGGGYLEQFGGPGGWSEVYTVPLSSRLGTGVIDLALHVSDGGKTCRNIIDVAVLQSAEGAAARVSNVRFTPGACGVSMAGYEVKHALGDLRVAAR